MVIPRRAFPTGLETFPVLPQAPGVLPHSHGLPQRPHHWVDPFERRTQVSAGQPHAVTCIQAIELFMPAGINHWVAHTHVTRIPDPVTGVPDTPRKFDAFVRVPEATGPPAGFVEEVPRHNQAGLPYVEHVAGNVWSAFPDTRRPAAGRLARSSRVHDLRL